MFPPLSYYNAIIVFHCRISDDVLFSRDTLPPLVLVVLIRYSKTSIKSLCCASSQGGTKVVVVVGSDRASFTQRRTTDADNPTRPMTTIQVVINGNQVEGQIDEIAKILGMVSNTMAQSVSPTLEEELLPFNKFAIQELTPHLGQELAEQVVNKLENCAKSYFPDFRHFIGMYTKVAGNIEHRQLLKTISAVYRFKFGRYTNDAAKYSLKSEIKYATICPHCGAIASAFVTRLQKEGLWV